MYLPEDSKDLRKSWDSFAPGTSENDVIYVKFSLNHSNKCWKVLFQLIAIKFSNKACFAKPSQFSDLVFVAVILETGKRDQIVYKQETL